MSETLQNQPIEYNMKVVRQFTVMTIIWGIVGMGLGVLIAAQLVWPELNFNTPWLYALAHLLASPSTSHQCRYLCFWYQCIVCYLLLRCSKDM